MWICLSLILSTHVSLFPRNVGLLFSASFPFPSRLPLPVRQLPSLSSFIPFFISPSACVICFFSLLPSHFHCRSPVSRHVIIRPASLLLLALPPFILLSFPLLPFPFPSQAHALSAGRQVRKPERPYDANSNVLDEHMLLLNS